MFFDPVYIIMMLPALLFAGWAQMKTSSNFKKYSQVPNSANLTGAEAAAYMLKGMGLNIARSSEEATRSDNAVAIEAVDGFLSDHYDPSAKTLRLSPHVYEGRSLSAVGVACHEAGHALQHAQGYSFLQMRTMLVPTASIGSGLAFPLILGGMLLSMANLVLIGVIMFTAVVAFQAITLPVEFDASKRAKVALAKLEITRGQEEQAGVAKVLNAAALTYVAAAVAAILNLLYYLMIFSGMHSNE
jgi:Zn-dependent membrane protease YugP